MKTFNKYSFTILFLFFFTGASYSFSLELSKGVLQEFGMSFTAEQRLALPKVTKTIDAVEPTGGAMSLAFVNVRETDEWYRLFDNMKLYGVNVKEEKLRGVWPLTPWPYRYASPAVIVQYGELALEYPSTSSDFEYRIYPGVGCYGTFHFAMAMWRVMAKVNWSYSLGTSLLYSRLKRAKLYLLKS